MCVRTERLERLNPLVGVELRGVERGRIGRAACDTRCGRLFSTYWLLHQARARLWDLLWLRAWVGEAGKWQGGRGVTKVTLARTASRGHVKVAT